MLNRTPLWQCHRDLGAKMVDFAGWDMPVLYTSILEEARAVRTRAGIFDISHMGRIELAGDGALKLLQAVTTNDVAALSPGAAQYSLITNPGGGIVDDIIVYERAPGNFLVVINASNSMKDIRWIQERMSAADNLTDLTRETAMIAVQGPEAVSLVAALAGAHELNDLPRFHFASGRIGAIDALLCRTGYTGEDGFEVIVADRDASALWQSLLNAGAAPCGLGARDALRIEAGYPLYGHEIDDSTTPVEAGLMWVVKMGKGPFTGSEPIAAMKASGPPRKLMGIRLHERLQPRQGCAILMHDQRVGEVTSGVFSPSLGHSVAMGYVAAEYARTGIDVQIEVRDKRAAGTLVAKKELLERG